MKLPRKLWLIGWLGVLLVLCRAGSAEAVTLTFDELAFQGESVHDLSVMGVTFDFKVDGVDSTDATYHSSSVGTITFIDDPALESNADGVLTLEFDSPTRRLAFGVAFTVFDVVSPGFSVELFDPSFASLGVTDVDMNRLISFSEGLFTYSGPLVSRAEVKFFHPVGPEILFRRFALDNLTFTPIPEPGTLLLLASGLAGLGLWNGKRRRSVS